MKYLRIIIPLLHCDDWTYVIDFQIQNFEKIVKFSTWFTEVKMLAIALLRMRIMNYLRVQFLKYSWAEDGCIEQQLLLCGSLQKMSVLVTSYWIPMGRVVHEYGFYSSDWYMVFVVMVTRVFISATNQGELFCLESQGASFLYLFYS